MYVSCWIKRRQKKLAVSVASLDFWMNVYYVKELNRSWIDVNANHSYRLKFIWWLQCKCDSRRQPWRYSPMGTFTTHNAYSPVIFPCFWKMDSSQDSVQLCKFLHYQHLPSQNKCQFAVRLVSFLLHLLINSLQCNVKEIKFRLKLTAAVIDQTNTANIHVQTIQKKKHMLKMIILDVNALFQLFHNTQMKTYKCFLCKKFSFFRKAKR